MKPLISLMSIRDSTTATTTTQEYMLIGDQAVTKLQIRIVVFVRTNRSISYIVDN